MWAQRIKVECLGDENSLAYLRHLLPVEPLQFERTFEARPAGEWEATFLSIPLQQTILVLARIVYGQSHQPIEYLNALFVGDRVNYRMA